MKKCFLFIGGEGPAGSELPEKPENGDVVIAADSGADLALKFSVAVDYAVGDFDSIREPALLDRLEKGKVFSYDRNKDLTDTEIAMETAISLGCTEAVLVGGGGGRFDHLLAVAALFERAHPPRRWYASFGKAVLIDTASTFEEPAGSLVSFFPLGREECAPWSSGLAWELEGLRWGRGDFGISNKTLKNNFQVGVHTGRMLMIIQSM